MGEVINILLVDDEERNLDALEVILDDPGYRLLRAGDADTALRTLLENGDVAAIVLDIKMPGVSGFELAKLIKGSKRFRQVPIVFLTAYMVDDHDVLEGYGAGAVDYLTKPVNPAVLRHKIEVFAELFRKTREVSMLNETLEARVQERTEELEKSEAALRAANEQKDAFIATLAHELRNPLAPMRTGLDLLLGMPNPAPAATRTMAAMNRQLDHMVRLIDDLLDVSRITRGLLELRKDHVEVKAIIDQAIETARPMLQQRRQTVDVRVPEPSILANVDATRVCQIVHNLLHNASKFTPIDGQIVVEVARSGSQVTVQIIDTGAGIPPEQLDRVFEMFARVERSMPNANTGLGIGLALSRRLAELHSGSLVAASAGEGQGATFTLTLPLPASTPIPVITTREVTEPGSPLRIVVIEDNTDAAETLVMWLEELGHTVRLATTGPDGVDLVLEATPDLVLCDVGLPGMDGVEVCKRVRGLCERNLVMVALTGWGMESDRKRTGEAGFDHHLVKPVALEKLRHILGSVRKAS